jgi:hypothetical protein
MTDATPDITGQLIAAARELLKETDTDLLERLGNAVREWSDEQPNGWRIDVVISTIIDGLAYLIAEYGATDATTKRGLLASSAAALSLLGNDFINEKTPPAERPN